MANPTYPPEGEPLIRAIAMPADANPSGGIFGGWLMSQMDLAAANAASRRSRGRCVTVTVDGMVFHEPVFIGDEVSLYCRILRVGRTSMTIQYQLANAEILSTAEAELKVSGGLTRRPNSILTPRLPLADSRKTIVSNQSGGSTSEIL